MRSKSIWNRANQRGWTESGAGLRSSRPLDKAWTRWQSEAAGGLDRVEVLFEVLRTSLQGAGGPARRALHQPRSSGMACPASDGSEPRCTASPRLKDGYC